MEPKPRSRGARERAPHLVDIHALWRRAREIAARQRSCIARRQLLALGITSNMIRQRLRTGELVPMHRGVYRFAPIAVPGADEMAAVLAYEPRACISHASATYLRELPPSPAKLALVHVTVVGRHVSARPGIALHETGPLLRSEVERLDGIPVTTTSRAILDLSRSLSLTDLEHLIAQAYAKRLTSRQKLLVLVDRYQGRPGTPKLRQLLDAPSAPARTRSNPERLLLDLIRRAKLPAPRTNAKLHGWEVDFLWGEAHLVVEVDALSTHTDPFTFERDRRKDAELTLRGYTVLRVTKRQLEEEPEAVIARIAAALTLRGAA